MKVNDPTIDFFCVGVSGKPYSVLFTVSRDIRSLLEWNFLLASFRTSGVWD